MLELSKQTSHQRFDAIRLNGLKSKVFLLLVIATAGIPCWRVLAEEPVAPNDNARPPFMAVYKGSVLGVKNPYGIKRVDAYAKWLNRKVIWAEDGMPMMNWDAMEGQRWQLEPWSVWVKEVSGRRLILSVPILPGGWDGSGPKTGKDANVPVSLEEGAKGAYNEHFKILAQNLVRYGLGDSILRLGWEFNGGWYTWHVTTNAKAEAFAGYFRQIVKTMRSVPGAEHLHFNWNAAMYPCYIDFEKAWPGDEYVDTIGLDVYDAAYLPDTYPLPKDASPSQIEAIHKKVWKEVLSNKTLSGLEYWQAFAKKHNKPLSFPEWGIDIRPDGHGGGDNPYFIQQMYKFINDPENNVYFHSYFDYQAGDGHHQLAPSENGTVVTQCPQSAEKFKELFALPEQE